MNRATKGQRGAGRNPTFDPHDAKAQPLLHGRGMHPIQHMEELAAEFRHLQAEHERKQIESRARRREEGRLKELEEQFQRLLEHWVVAGDERDAWRQHLYRGSSPPSSSLAEPPLFKGRSETGSLLEIWSRSDGETEVIVDGTPVDRRSANYEPGSSVRVGGLIFEETFQAPEPALEALRAHLANPSGDVPWRHARELYEDGLIDENGSLTPRGQRFKRRAFSA